MGTRARFVARFALVCALAVSCSSSSNEPATSALGESCSATADCQTGLVCLANTCAPSGQGHMVDGGGPGPDGAPNVTSGGDASGSDAAGSDSGVIRSTDASDEQRLGQIGEACQTSRDCASGLGCVPASGGASVCDLLSYGLMPSGKTCSGECSAASDCCALPPGLGLSAIDDAGFYVSVADCQDVLSVMIGGDIAACARGPGPGTVATGCFVYQTYCSCSANTWACTNGRCAYTASCTGTMGNTLGGCPLLTRNGATLNTTCDMPAGKCHSGLSGCMTDTDCNGLAVSDEVGITCRSGDCTCYMSACYLKCAKDLDCQNGKSCDAMTKLCVPSPCTTNSQCFSQLGKARAQCNSGVCGIPCTTDQDCSPSGDLSGQPFNGTVCGPKGVCTPVGCTSDADCSGVGSTRLFCATPQVSGVHSAVTN